MKLQCAQSGETVSPGFFLSRRRLGLTLSALALSASLSLCGAISRADTPTPAASKTDAFLSRKLASKPTSGWTSVVVKLDGPLTKEQAARLKLLHADIYRRLDIIHSVALRVPSRNLAKLAALAFVKHLSADEAVKKTDQFTTQSSLATTAWQKPYNVSGAGVTVAVVDTGIDGTNPDLQLKVSVLGLLGVSVPMIQPTVVASVNFVPNETSADDGCGHGTHVSGIIAGNGSASTGVTYYHTYYGIAPQAKLVNVRVLDEQGQGTVSQVISGIQWVVANKATYNIRVMNLSLGHDVGESYTTDPLCQAVEAAWKAGVVVICAAGNEGRLNADVTSGVTDNEGYGTNYGSIAVPGNDPYVITVGATKSMDGIRADDRIATYSSRGPARLDLILKPDIIAPGNRVISLDGPPRDYLMTNYAATNAITYSSYCTLALSSQNSYNYFCLSGTSMATPVISGAAALLLQANPNLSPDTVKARLMISADKWVSPMGMFDPCTYGAGYVNIPAALNCKAVARQAALSPTLSIDSQGDVYLDADRAVWGTSGIWGSGVNDFRAVWGTGLVNGDGVDCYRAVWGTSGISDASAVSEASVWSDRAVWGTDTSAADLSWTVINGE